MAKSQLNWTTLNPDEDLSEQARLAFDAMVNAQEACKAALLADAIAQGIAKEGDELQMAYRRGSLGVAITKREVKATGWAGLSPAVRQSVLIKAVK